ncbi:hypothetical protein GCM10010415_05110 [Streptomyces atrovirens]|uniref:Lipoprotein n=1 Tax=Streptomyces atrovirens TaxID=285556 RepID=A0ABW0DWP6_9ACTN
MSGHRNDPARLHTDGCAQDFDVRGSYSYSTEEGEMSTRAIRRTAAGLLPGLLPLLAVAACGEEPEKHFPGAFPGTHTDVSADRAFRDHGLQVPDSVSGSGPRPASSVEGGVVGVEVSDEDHGWAGDEADPRYPRDRDHAGAVAHRTGTERTVYPHT